MVGNALPPPRRPTSRRPLEAPRGGRAAEEGAPERAFGKRFRRYSIATIVVLLVSGTLTSLYGPRIAAHPPTPWDGVFERIDLGGYLV